LAEFRSPGASVRAQSQDALATEYDRLWAYYRNNSAYVYSQGYLNLCRQLGQALYNYTRLLFNPVPTIVAFYEDHLFPGVAQEVKDDRGVTLAHLATPLVDGTDPALQLAIAQLDQWSNWLSESQRFVRYGAALGSVGAEVLDLDRAQKVTHRILWPSWIDLDALKLDEAGNVKAYALQYKVREESETYTFRKEVDGESFRYFRDKRPFDPPERGTNDAHYVSRGVYDNPYSFVPMVWCKHADDGELRGLAAVSDHTLVDEVNSLASHGHDHGHKAIEAGKIIFTDGDILPVTGASGESKRNAEGGIHPYDTRYDWTVLKASGTGSVSDLGSSFELSQLDPQIERLLTAFEKRYPELQAQEIIQNKSQLALGTLERLLAPSQSKLDRAFAQYGQQVVKLKQMGVAIAGWRTRNGWTMRDAQHEAFREFDLDSYSKGKLNFSLRRPLLVQSTPMEEEELKEKKLTNAKAQEGLIDDRTRLIELGYTPERADEILKARSAKPEGEE